MKNNLLVIAQLMAIVGVMLTWNSASYADACIDENNIAKTDGKCWRELSPAIKAAIVRGIWVGQDVQATALEMRAEKGATWFGINWGSVPDGTSVGDITEYFDKLYETPANRGIQWRYAYLLAALAARDDDENDRLSLLTFLRTNDDLPFSGILVGVKADNVVEIQSGDKRYEVRLSGLSVPESVAPVARQFLRGLMQSGILGNCTKPEPTPVQLNYGTELFDGQGRLTADVRISSFYDICVGTKAVPLSDSDGIFTNIGYFMISNGLAEVDNRIDPKWSEDRKRGNSNEYAVEQAKKSKLYFYGELTNPKIEIISGRLSPDTY